MGLLLGCGSPAAPLEDTTVPGEVYSFAPSPLLALARSERELPPVRRHWLRKRFADPTSEPDPEDTEVDEDGIHRTVRVHPFRLATPEELTRAALRNAEARRPRELHPMRFLVRTSRVRAATSKRRLRTRSIVESRDEAIARCLVEEVSSRHDVILRTPAALVLEEATRTGPITYGIAVAFRGRREPSVTIDPPVSEPTTTCLTEALAPRPTEDLRTDRVELTAFSQRSWGMGGSALHQRLANEAAMLGWIELERGAHEEALAYFEDAFWLYHRPEYELLQAMALQKMGKPNMALTRYRRFVEARPHAPETPLLRERIAQLEAK